MSAKAKTTEKIETVPKLRIKLRAYDHKVIDKSAEQIVDMVLRCGAEVSGPVPLPIELSKFTVNRSCLLYTSRCV